MKRPEERLTPGAKAIRMPCGWGCEANLTSTEMRAHFKRCPNRGAETIVTVVRLPLLVPGYAPRVEQRQVARQEGERERLIPVDEL